MRTAYVKINKILQKRYLLFAVTILFLIGCKKEEEEIQSYLRMELDGVKVACNEHIKATPNDGFTSLLGISGNWNSTPLESGAIEIEVYSFDNTPGEKQLISPSNITVWLTHKDGRGGEISDTYVASGINNKDVQLNILEVNQKYIKGTFSGMLTQNKLITNGEFYIKRGW